MKARERKFLGPAPHWQKPCAAEGLKSYRYKGRYGWIMIGAKDHSDALYEASRSTDNVHPRNLQYWDGKKYVTVPKARWYHVCVWRDDKGTKTYASRSPMTHDEACTFKSKMTEHKLTRIGLEEVRWVEKVTAPKDMGEHIAIAKYSKDAADYIEKIRRAPENQVRVSSKTQAWFSGRYQTGWGTKVFEKDVQKFVDDAKAGVFD